MTGTHLAPTTALDALAWRKSSYSTGQGGDCVELAPLPDGTIAVRSSNRLELGALVFSRTEIRAWLDSTKNGDFDHLA